jgi:hypothetical protein
MYINKNNNSIKMSITTKSHKIILDAKKKITEKNQLNDKNKIKTNKNDNNLIKLLLINSLQIPVDMQNHIKDLLFIDKIQVTTRNNKNYLISNLKNKLVCFTCDSGFWSLLYRFERNLQADFCIICGGYSFVSNIISYQNISRSAVCSCQGFEERYQQNAEVFNAPPLIMYT